MRRLSSKGVRRTGAAMSLMVLMVVLLVAVGTGCSSNSSGGRVQQGRQQTIELKLAHFFPATHPAETDLVQPWARAIEEATGGKVKITSYPGSTLLKPEATYDGVVNGVADIGLSCYAYTRGRFPVLEVFELPGIVYENSKVASKVAREGIKQLNPEEIQDTKLMMVLTTGPGDLFTKKPVRTLEDLKGMSIRATGLSAQTLEMLGATPVAMPQSEAYEAISKGVVQGNLGPQEVLKGWKNAEVTDYITLTPFLYNTVFFITMNMDRWNSLSPELQQTIEDINEKYFTEVAMGLWDMQNEEALRWAVDETGMEVITLPEEEANRWIELVQPIQDEFVAKMNEKGFNGQEILDLVKGLADQYNDEF